MRKTSKRVCERIQPMLSAYADGELNQRQAAAVRVHVCSCSSCAQELEQIKTVRALLQESADEAQLPARVHASVMNAVSQMPRTARAGATRTVWLRRVGGAMACIGCLCVIGVAVFMGGAGQKAFDAMMPGASAPEASDAPDAAFDADVPYGDVNDKYSGGSNAPTDPMPVPPAEREEPDMPEAPTDPALPEDVPPESAERTQYKLQRTDGAGEGLDGVWACDDLKISLSTNTQRIEVWFAHESSREGSYELTDTELTVYFEDGEQVIFDYQLDGKLLYLNKKEP